MKVKSFILLICSITISSLLSAQVYPVDKKATIIGGTGSFMSQGGDLFEDSDGKKATNITFAPTFSHFITKNLFIGGGISLSTNSQGDYSTHSIGIGPQIGYAFGNSNSTVYPYVDLGILYYKMNADYGYGDDIQVSGSDISLGFGMIIPVKTHIGLVFEGGYNMMDLKNKDSDDTVSGNIFSIGVGLVGLLFQDAK